jgi:hypothetical protein
VTVSIPSGVFVVSGVSAPSLVGARTLSLVALGRPWGEFELIGISGEGAGYR